MSTPREPIFYTLPAHLVEEGMSTACGQDVLACHLRYPWVMIEVYTPRPDAPDQDERNRAESDTWTCKIDQPVELAVFDNTEVNASDWPEASPLHTVALA